MTCSARSLGSARSSASSARVLVGRRAARPRARRWAAPRPRPPSSAHQRLGRRAGDQRLGELEVEHVRRRVDHPQRAVDVERIDPAARHLEALRETTWKASPARMYSCTRRTPPRTAPRVTFERGGAGAGAGERLERAQRRRRPRQPLEHRVDARAGVVVGAPRSPCLPVDVDRRHHLQRPAQVVEDHHRVGDREADLGQAQVVGRGAGDASRSRARRRSRASRPRRRRSAAAPAAPRAPARPGRRRGTRAAARRAPRSVTRSSPSTEVSTSTSVAARPHDRARPHADEAVGGPLLAADDALEQERVRPAAQLGVGRDRRVGVGEHLAIDEGRAGPGGPGRRTQNDRERTALSRPAYHGVIETSDDHHRMTSRRGRRASAMHELRAFGPALRYHGAPRAPPLVPPDSPSPAPGPATRRFVAWTLRHGALLWALAVLLAIPAAWRTAHALREPAQRDRGAPAARRAQRRGDRRAAPPHGGSAVPGRRRRRRRRPTACRPPSVLRRSRGARPPLPARARSAPCAPAGGRARVRREARGSLLALADLQTIRERIEERIHWEYANADRHAARRRRAGAAARLHRHREEVRAPARRPRPESATASRAGSWA